ncbi:MAG: aldo/keto reductase [Candidatus Sumerlaeia bacterium]|nr:aldo/keto reductase [Candidatus Sumerlaeia bacterium]
MEKRKLGNSDLSLTVVGFGSWAIGGPWKMGWGPTDDKESEAAIKSALDNGINWIDTAPVYGFGHSEEVVGRAIKGRRDKVIIATKCGLVPDGEGGAKGQLKRQSVRQELEDSLRRLGTDVIDLYQIHWPNPEEDIEEAWTEMNKAKEEGLVRWCGVSNFSVEQMKKVSKIAPVTSDQPPYSMLRTAIEEDIMPWCGEHNVGLVTYAPMLSGVLTGKQTHERAKNLPEGDFRRNNKEWKEPNLSANIDFVENVLRPIGKKHGVEPGQVAIAWVLKDKRVTSAIVGGRNPAQAKNNAKAAGVSLDADDLGAIAEGIRLRAAKVE